MAQQSPSRRDLILASAAGLAVTAAPAAEPPARVSRIGVISATIRGKSQARNGHTWHFAHYLHPTINLDAITKYHHPGFAPEFAFQRDPRNGFNLFPFPDTKITHYFDKDPAESKRFAEAFPGVKPAESVEKMVQEVDAVWLGDASGFGEDHFDLIAPGLARGLPTFCDKPIGGTVAGTRKILDFAREHKAPIMSSSLFRHEWGTEMALRMRDAKEHGPLHYVIASMYGGYNPDGWLVYGQHPIWMVMTLCGPGVEAVSLYAREASAHALMTYPDRMPGEVWYGRPDIGGEYCQTIVNFTKKTYTYTPSIEGSFRLGHHYEMLRMAATFRDMVRTGTEPIPHREILEVTAVVHAGVKSRQEKSRLVELAEVMM